MFKHIFLIILFCLGTFFICLAEENNDENKPLGERGLRKELMRKYGGIKKTENAVQAGLIWLARHQNLDGSWGAVSFQKQCKDSPCTDKGNINVNIGLTGLALLAFTGANYTPSSEDNHQGICFGDVVRKAALYLKNIQSEDGSFGDPTGEKFMFNHAVATYALVDLVTLMKGEDENEDSSLFTNPVQKGIDIIISAQSSGKAWHYNSKCEGNDTFVTGWCAMALKAAEKAGLKVSQTVWSGIKSYLKDATDAHSGRVACTAKKKKSKPAKKIKRFRRSHRDKKKDKDKKRLPAMTAAGVIMRILMEENEGNSLIRRGVTLLMRELPAKYKIDYYYWYYGSYALYQHEGPEGPYWNQWNEALKDVLLNTQKISSDSCANGSWDPEDKWGKEGGRVYSTAVSILTLEVYYRLKPADASSVGSNNETAKQLYLDGISHFALKQYEEAEKFFLRAIGENPNYPEALFKLAQIYDQAKDDMLALKYYKKSLICLKLKGVTANSPLTQIIEGVEKRIPKLEKTNEVLKKLHTDYINKLSKSGRKYFDKEKYASALLVYKEILRYDSDNRSAKEATVQTKLELGTQLKPKKENLKVVGVKLQRMRDGYLKQLVKTGKQHLRGKKYGSARIAFQKALELDETCEEATRGLEQVRQTSDQEIGLGWVYLFKGKLVGWMILRGNWKTEEASLIADPTEDGRLCILYVDQKMPSDYAISFDIWFANGFINRSFGGSTFWVDSAQDHNQFSMTLFGNKSTFSLSRFCNHQWVTDGKEQVKFKIDKEKWYRIQIKVKNSKEIEVTLDDKLIFTGSFSGNVIPSRFGLAAQEGKVKFKNIKLRNLR